MLDVIRLRRPVAPCYDISVLRAERSTIQGRKRLTSWSDRPYILQPSPLKPRRAFDAVVEIVGELAEIDQPVLITERFLVRLAIDDGFQKIFGKKRLLYIMQHLIEAIAVGGWTGVVAPELEIARPVPMIRMTFR